MKKRKIKIDTIFVEIDVEKIKKMDKIWYFTVTVSFN